MLESTLKDKEEMKIHVMWRVIMLIYNDNDNGEKHDKRIR